MTRPLAILAILVTVTIALLLFLGGLAPADGPSFKLIVDAGAHDRHNTPMRVLLVLTADEAANKHPRLADARGKAVLPIWSNA